MTDIYTVIFTATEKHEAESIPWILSFVDLDLAKNHVLEEAAATAKALEPLEPLVTWVDYEEYSLYTQEYQAGIRDVWMIVRTELVEKTPTTNLTGL